MFEGESSPSSAVLTASVSPAKGAGPATDAGPGTGPATDAGTGPADGTDTARPGRPPAAPGRPAGRGGERSRSLFIPERSRSGRPPLPEDSVVVGEDGRLMAGGLLLQRGEAGEALQEPVHPRCGERSHSQVQGKEGRKWVGPTNERGAGLGGGLDNIVSAPFPLSHTRHRVADKNVIHCFQTVKVQ